MPGRFNLARRPFVDTRPANLTALVSRSSSSLGALLRRRAHRDPLPHRLEPDARRRSRSLRAEIASLEEERRRRPRRRSRGVDVGVARRGRRGRERDRAEARVLVDAVPDASREDAAAPTCAIASIALQKVTGGAGRRRRDRARGSGETVARGLDAHLARSERPAEDDPRLRRVAVVRTADAGERGPRREGPARGPPAPLSGRRTTTSRARPEGRPMSAPAVSNGCLAAARALGTAARLLRPRAAGGIRASAVAHARCPSSPCSAPSRRGARPSSSATTRFYDARFKALETTRAELEAQARRGRRGRAPGRKAPSSACARSRGTSRTFNRDVLGDAQGAARRRSSRTSTLLTQKAGTRARPDRVRVRRGRRRRRASRSRSPSRAATPTSRSSSSRSRTTRGSSSSRTSPLATDDAQPDVLRLNLTVAHYFRPDGRRAARGRRGLSARRARPRPAATADAGRRRECRNERARKAPKSNTQAPPLRARSPSWASRRCPTLAVGADEAATRPPPASPAIRAARAPRAAPSDPRRCRTSTQRRRRAAPRSGTWAGTSSASSSTPTPTPRPTPIPTPDADPAGQPALRRADADPADADAHPDRPAGDSVQGARHLRVARRPRSCRSKRAAASSTPARATSSTAASRSTRSTASPSTSRFPGLPPEITRRIPIPLP